MGKSGTSGPSGSSGGNFFHSLVIENYTTALDKWGKIQYNASHVSIKRRKVEESDGFYPCTKALPEFIRI